ncbi:uncharacterized protein HMPREF1541_06883 [Cyphellophora europaea CBS 101466]|uniref:Major facilitator superfamily (MFS) profile domain-containing protein n=1 Tax=Cyphellophora europaea (strain CBS 101466) TaxID=1220924 RepID=W2RQV2_CYPE1|nr:uncharacterized protein HMPREF1541_06883 [Cyphellophora europaea CBS 101466]ETN38842.1 hypothetical protein HMPREF1541_06883 [Cyphellophora europaea CBS 101466]
MASYGTDNESINSTTSNDEAIPVKSLEKHAPSRQAELDTDTDDIHYEYLNFTTELPPYALTSPYPDGPQPPNLKKYDNPFGWSRAHKNTILFLCTASTWCAAYSAGSYSIASEPMREKWGLSLVAFNTGVTCWAAGFGIAPMFLAPFSEINGRKPVFLASGFVLLAAQIGCAFADTFAGMLVARFFVGAAASTFSTIIGGVLSDIYHAEDRNTPMAVYSGGALAGTGFGPFLCGFIIDRASYRWVFYHQIASIGVLVIIMTLFFRETRGSVLLSRRAKVLNDYFAALENSGYLPPQNADNTTTTSPSSNPAKRLRYRCLADEQRATISRMIYLSLTTPFKLLSTEPVVFFFSMWAAFAWAVLYMTFAVIPVVFTARHNFDAQANGLVFLAIAIGAIVGALLSIYQERVARAYFPDLLQKPEGRLYFACLESALLPIGLFWFGWTSFSSVHWASPVIALGVAQVGIFSIYLAVFNYLADVYHRYASSALAGQSFCRNVGAAVFPLFTVQMFQGLGFPGAASLLGGVGALLTLVPWVLVFHGEKIRRRSRIAREIMGE